MWMSRKMAKRFLNSMDEDASPKVWAAVSSLLQKKECEHWIRYRKGEETRCFSCGIKTPKNEAIQEPTPV